MWSAAPSTAGAAEPIVLFGGVDGELFRAFDDGSGVAQVTDCGAEGLGCQFANLSLSPSGRTAAFDVGTHRIEAVNIDGHAPRVLMDDAASYPTGPAFLPDSRTVAFTASPPTEDTSPTCPAGFEITFSIMASGYYDFNDDGLICQRAGTECFIDAGLGTTEDIFTVPLYAPEGEIPAVTPLITGAGHQRDPDFSADGAALVYSGQGAPGQPLKLMLVGSDGCNPQVVDTSSVEGDIYEPKLSPAGGRIVFYARPVAYTVPESEDSDLEIWSVNADGSDLTRLTSNETDDYGPNWSPDGLHILYDGGGGYEAWSMAADGSNAHRVFGTGNGPDPSGVTAENEGTYRTSSTALDDSDLLAASFSPIFLFDSTEQWRPLALSPFIREEDPNYPGSPLHHVCDPSGCTTDVLSDGLDRLRQFPTGWIDIVNTSYTTSPGDFKSPRAACTADGLSDCNSGSDTAAYYRAASTENYTYLDYWLFYRFNDHLINEHEGDWEGVTIGVPQADPVRFDFASFAQHNTRSTYLRSSLQCDEGGNGSCGTDALPIGSRVRVFVASGSHASYPGPCSAEWIPPTICGQPDFPAEADHDGEAAWGRNHDDPLAGTFFRFPQATNTWTSDPATAQWVNWPGRWGESCVPDFDCSPPFFNSPQSPGMQPRFNCPQDGNEFDSTACPLPLSRRTTTAQPASRPAAPDGCGTWFGADVAAAACSRTRLRHSVAAGVLGRTGSFAFSSRSRRFRTGSAPGIAQALGQPLRRGEKLSLTGTGARGTQLGVRAIEGRRLLQATFTNLRLRGGRAVVRLVGPPSAPQLVLRRQDGTRLRPRWTKAFRLTRRGAVPIGNVRLPASRGKRPTYRPTRPSARGSRPRSGGAGYVRRDPQPKRP